MARRRPPPKRPSASPSTLARKNSDTRKLVNPGPSFTGTEMTGCVRAILLGALVAGVAAFLFYPDISRLLESWELEGFHSSDLHSGKEPNNNGDKPAEADQVKPDPKTARKARSVKETTSTTTTTSKSSSSKSTTGSKSGGKNPSTTTTTTTTTTSTASNSNGAGKSKKAKAAKRVKETRPARHEETMECTCQQHSDPQPSPPPPPPKRKKTKPKKPKAPPKEDLMEGEEEEEGEEDSELQLLEIEEPAEFIELEADEEEEEEEEEEEGSSPGPGSATESSDHGESTEPVSLQDGDTITFTPLSPGDENVIRLGGRPKTDRQGSSRDRRHSDKPKPKPDASGSTSSSRNSSANTDTRSKKTSKTTAMDSSDRDPRKSPKDSRKEGKKMTSTESQTTTTEDPELADLPEEVRNFKPTFQKTVTPKKIFAGGRRIPPVELIPQKDTNSSVKVFLFNEFLSEEECDGLRRVHDKHVQEMSTQPLLCFDSLATLRKHLHDVRQDVRVTPNVFVKGTKCVNATFSRQLGQWMSGNWSYSTAFYPGESRFSTIFADRVRQAMGLDPRNGGKFQITSYPQGKAYKAHTDCVLDGTDPRDRVASVLVYLDDVEDGGETKFPELGIWVKPRKGRALVWNNMSPQGVCEPHSLHVASKVNQGSKYILIRWYYYKSFYSLGKRPPEPPLPDRPAATPRVSCDDYDNGSCRWYDEWNNDHLLDYEYKKYTLI